MTAAQSHEQEVHLGWAVPDWPNHDVIYLEQGIILFS